MDDSFFFFFLASCSSKLCQMTQVPKVVLHLTRKPRIHIRYDRGCVYVRDGIICDLDIPIFRVVCGCSGFYHYSNSMRGIPIPAIPYPGLWRSVAG